jgi:integrase/recombinase XerD
MAEMSPLRRRMTEDLTVRNLSPATQRSYLHAVTKFSRYFGRSPDRLDLEDVRAFQVHLVSTGISWPALNQTVCALRFFYGVTLRHGEIPERIPYAREPRRLPVVLNADEVVRFLEAVPSLKTRAALTTAYAAGLRASEAVGLKVADIDSVRMVIRVEHGKGGKDRTVMLSTQLLGILRTCWRLARSGHWLFPVLVALSLDFDDGLPAGKVEAVVTEIERQIKAAHPEVTRVFVEAQSFDAHRRDFEKRVAQLQSQPRSIERDASAGRAAP